MNYYGRLIRIEVADLLIEKLRVQFEVEKSLVGYPNKALIKIYNLSSISRQSIEEEGLDILLYAGYNPIPVLIFSGNIINVVHIKVGVDWITEIYAGDSSNAINNSTINTTIPAGATAETILNTLIDNMQGVTKGLTEGLANCINGRRSLLRRYMLAGNIKDFLRELAEQCGFDYSINDGVLETTQPGLPLTDQAPIIINQRTGMIGSPERTDVGVTVKHLLLPDIKLGRRFQIQSVTEKLNVGNLFFRKVPAIRNQGIYRADKIIHRGDTHDNQWETVISGRVF